MSAGPMGLPARWRHQQAALEFVENLWKSGRKGGMLAICMGGGKSRVTVDLTVGLGARQALVLSPLRVVEVWRQQFLQYAPGQFEFLALDDRAGKVRDKCRLAQEQLPWAMDHHRRLVICINYEAARTEPFASWALNQIWDIVIADECVPPGSMIATPEGPVPIEKLRIGDVIWGYDHASNTPLKTTITAVFQHQTDNSFVTIQDSQLTPDHPVWTMNRGYIAARLIHTSDEVLYATNSKQDTSTGLPVLRKILLQRPCNPGILQPELCLESADEHAGSSIAKRHAHARYADAPGSAGQNTETFSIGNQPVPTSRNAEESTSQTAGDQLSDAHWWQRPRSLETAIATGTAIELAHGMDCAYPHGQGFWLSDPLQNRYCRSGPTGRNRSRWPHSQNSANSGIGRQERHLPRVLWMASPTLLELGDFGKSQPGRKSHPVHNLETGTGNYFVNGLLVHNCHRLADPGGRTSRWCARLGMRAGRRLALTGTPYCHSPLSIWGQFRFLDPHHLDPTYMMFRERYAEMGGYHDKQIVKWKNLPELEARFRQLAFRVDESVLDLPPELDQTLECDLEAGARKIYDDMEARMVAWIEETRVVTAANAMVRLLRLEQITGGTLKDDQDLETIVSHAKEYLLAEFFEDLKRDEPVVVFARFKSDLRAVHRAAARARGRLIQQGLVTHVVTAELSGDDHQGLGLWQKGEAQILAVQIQAGGVGIDLTRARIALYYSLGFSLTDYLQSRARIRRPPQSRPCLFIHLQVRNSIDVAILHAIERRHDLVDSVLDHLRSKKGRTHAPSPA